MDKSQPTFAGIMLAVFAIIVGVALHGYTVMHMWTWFVVPLGVMSLSYWHAFGLCAVVRYMTFTNTHLLAKKDHKWWEPVVMAVSVPAGVLLIGYIIHCLM
jgi:hypothetical protein